MHDKTGAEPMVCLTIMEMLNIGTFICKRRMGIESHRPYLNTETSNLCTQATLVTLQCFKFDRCIELNVLMSFYPQFLNVSVVKFGGIHLDGVSNGYPDCCRVRVVNLFLNVCVMFSSKLIFHVRCLTYSSEESYEYRKFYTWRF
jgi:hypothetical protein